MLSIPTDRDFSGFVTRCRTAGMSSASIAAALNHSAWADPYGRHWSYQQVAGLCWSADSRPAPGHPAAELAESTSAGDNVPVAADHLSCTRADCEFHRLQAVLRSILKWSPFDPEQARLIAKRHGKGASAGSIAAELNVARLHPPAGRRWTAGLVRALVDLYAFEREVSSDPTLTDRAVARAAA